MSKKLSEYEKQTVKEMKEASALLEEFGLQLHGYGPGVTAWFRPTENGSKLNTGFSGVMGVSGRGYWGEPIAMSRLEWEWLKPLLEELRDLRKKHG